jgi:integrase
MLSDSRSPVTWPGYRGLTREAHTPGLRPFTSWCRARSVPLFSVRRHSPAARVRRPRLDYESHATALDRNEAGALLVAAGLGAAAGHALISLLGLNGLRVPEAIGAGIEHLGLERGHRTLVITRKGGEVVAIPLAPRTARAIDLAIGERTAGPLFPTADGKRSGRHGAARIVRRVTPDRPISGQVMAPGQTYR